MQPLAKGRTWIIAAAASAAVLLGGCASHQAVPAVIPDEGVWSFDGAVESAHRMRNRQERFTVPVQGDVTFRPDSVIVSGTHGRCGVPRTDLLRSGNQLRIRCDSIDLSLTPRQGRVTVPVQRMSEVPSGCRRHMNNDPRAACIEQDYQLVTSTVRASGRVQVVETGGAVVAKERGEP